MKSYVRPNKTIVNSIAGSGKRMPKELSRAFLSCRPMSPESRVADNSEGLNFGQLAQRIMEFNESLEIGEKIPKGIVVLNPFRQSEILEISLKFYSTYYSDAGKRIMILGINPGRLGAGSTGIPFTDTKRLTDVCGIPFQGLVTHEPSSVFIYDVIQAYGGPEKFYSHFYINSVCPLGFATQGPGSGLVNFNYYDRPELAKAVMPFILRCLRHQLSWGVLADQCVVLGTGKNDRFFRELNQKYAFFTHVDTLEHPRFIMQYRQKSKDEYVAKYVRLLRGIVSDCKLA